MPNQFFSPEGDLEEYFITEYWLIDQYVGDELWTWGSTGYGRLGNAQITTDRSTPVTTFAGGNNWKQVSSSGSNTSAIKTDGTLWLWGNSNNGALGNGVTTSGSISTPITTFAGGNDWKQVSSGSAIKTDGTLWTWGFGGNGALGNGLATGNRSTPVTTFAGGTNWKQVSGTAAIKTDGTLWIWGSNSFGQLGNNTTTAGISTPITTFAGGNNWKQVSSGGNFVAAIKTDGTLWLWGSTSYGILGNGVTTLGSISTPITTFAGGNNWKQVSAGNSYAAAIKTDGTLWLWGASNNGRLGNAVTTSGGIGTPITTFAGGNNWKQVSCSDGAGTAAIKTDGTLWMWGSGSSGKLGNRVVIGNISTPVTTFAGGTNWKQVSPAGSFTMAVFSGTTPDLPIS